MFPFGYGLSYTTFKFSNLKISRRRSRTRAPAPVPRVAAATGSRAPGGLSATVTNTGKVAGSDVAQLYLGDPGVAGEPRDS